MFFLFVRLSRKKSGVNIALHVFDLENLKRDRGEKKHCEVLFPPLPCAKLPANPEISCELAKGGCALCNSGPDTCCKYCLLYAAKYNSIQVLSVPHYRHKQLTSNYRVFFFINYTEIDLSYSIICRNIS